MCVLEAGGDAPLCCPCPGTTSKLSHAEEEEQPPKAGSEIRRVLSEGWQGAWQRQQLRPSLFCTKGPGCCCFSRTGTKVRCLCGNGECRGMRNGTETHRSGVNQPGDLAFLWHFRGGLGGWGQREHQEGSDGAKVQLVRKG